MYIPEGLLMAYPDGLSGLNIYCKDEQKDEIRSFFERAFGDEWLEAVKKVYVENDDEMDYEDLDDLDDDDLEMDDNSNPMRVEFTEKGLFADFWPLYIRIGCGDYCDNEHSKEALIAALKRLEEQYPDITYEGYIAYGWSDIHGGEGEQYPIVSKNTTEKDSYDFIGKKLNEICEDLSGDFRDDFIDWCYEGYAITEELKDFLRLAANHSEWVNAEAIYTFVLEVALEVAEEISEEDEEIDIDELNELVEKLKAGK